MRTFLFFVLPVLAISAADRDSKKFTSGELFEAIARMDRHLSDAFNAHSADRLMLIASKDLEFYQDNDGLKNYEQCLSEFKSIFARDENIRRELVEGTLEVYPIKGYGALATGQNRLCHKEKDKEVCGTFKFAMVWQNTGETWKLSRIISYGH